MSKQYIKFTEHNDWEGETWNYYVESESPEIQKLKESIVDNEFFEVNEEPIPENEVDIVCKHSDSGYMNYHNKVKDINFEQADEEDPMYKGGCFTFER